MSIQKISTDQLRRMGDQEGLILQGCGGDLQEWVDGINEILTEEGVLKKGARFEEAYTFKHDGLTCLLFPFKEDMQIEVGKLAAWRLETYPHFGGTWLSDYLNSTNFDTYKIIPDHIKHHLQKSHGILKKMLAFLCEVYYNRDILNPRKQGFVWH